MEELFPFLGSWVWWVIAGLLLFLELMAPGVFFIWLAIAAGLTGLADTMFDLPWQAEALLFAAAALVSVLVGRAVLKRRASSDSDHPHLNQRQRAFIGKSFTLKEPIRDGRGKLVIDDTVWDVMGPDAPAGSHVKVTGTDGMRLMVTGD